MLILVACELEEGTEYPFEAERDTLVQGSYSDPPPSLIEDDDELIEAEYEEGGELSCLTEGDEEEMNIYEMCWFEVRNTPRGQDLIAAYNEVLAIYGTFPGHLIARDVTYGRLKAGLEEALIPLEVLPGGRYRRDITPFVEAAGI